MMHQNSEHRIFVTQLTHDITWEALYQHFSQFGKLCECTRKVPVKNSKDPTYFAFVSYQDRKFAVSCLKARHMICNTYVTVKPAKEFLDLVDEEVVIPSKLFIGALPITCDGHELGQAFAPYGTVMNSMIMADRRTGRSRLFGYVQFREKNAVDKVLQDYHFHRIHGKWVETKRCVPKNRGGACRKIVEV